MHAVDLPCAWTVPADALHRSRAGEIFLLPPTVANLDWLSGFRTAADAMAAGLALDVEIVRPEIVVDEDGSIVLHIKDDSILLRPPTADA